MKGMFLQLHYGNWQFYNRGRNRISAAGHGRKRSVGHYQKLNTDLSVTMQALTLSSVWAASLYKTNTVIKLKVKANEVPDLVYRPQGGRYNPQYTCKRSCRVSVHCWGWISHEGAGVFQNGLHYQHILQNVTVPSVWIVYPEGIIHLQQDQSSIHDYRVVQEWLSWQATSNSLTGHRERLIWTPSRKRGVRWKGQCGKPDLSSLPEIAMSYGPSCQTRGMKLLHLRVTFDPWHDKWNQRSKQKGSGILIKLVNFCKKPF